MPTIQEVRKQYPQYDDMPDEQLAEGLHKKFYSDMPKDEFLGKIGMAAPKALAAGQIEAGNIDLGKRPVVKNPDGSVSTVRSMSANFDGREYLIPTVTDDGRVVSDDEAIKLFQTTGRHLGAFDKPENATRYAESLHRAQEAQYVPLPSTNMGKMFAGAENDVSAAMQGTTPHVRKLDGSLNYEPLGELIDADQGPSYEGPDGKWHLVDPKLHVMLQDPATNRQMIYKRDPAKEEGAITRIARMALPGMATVAPSRLAGGLASKAGQAAEAVAAAPTEQAQLVAAAQRQGIALPPAAVTDNFALQSAAKKLSDIEIVGAPIRKGITQAADAVQTGVEGAAAGFGGSRTLQEAGEGLQTAVEQFGARTPQYPTDRFQSVLARPLGEVGLRNKQKAAYDQVRQALPKDAAGPLDNTRLVLADIAAKDAAAGLRIQAEGRLKDIMDVVQDPTKELTFSGMQRLRTRLREMKQLDDGKKTLADHEIDALYGGLSTDLRTLAERSGGPRAATMLNRADQLTRTGEERLAKVLRPLGAKSAEGAAGTMLQWAQPGKQGNLAKLQAVRRSVDPDTWNELAAASIHQMAQGREGFSVAKLVTEYDKMAPRAKEVLFRSTGNGVIASNLDDLVTIAKSLKRVEALGNPSGSGKYATSAAVFGGAGTSAMMGDFITPLGVIGGGRLAAHFIASRPLTNWLTRGVRIQEAAAQAGPAAQPRYQQQWAAHLGQLRTIAAQNPEIAPGLEKYIDAIAGGGAQTGPSPQDRQPAPQ